MLEGKNKKIGMVILGQLASSLKEVVDLPFFLFFFFLHASLVKLNERVL